MPLKPPTRALFQGLSLMALMSLIGLLGLPSESRAADGTGSGRVASETRSVADFQRIELNGSMDLKVRQGTPQSVRVEADDNLLSLLQTVVEGSGNDARLSIQWQPRQSIRPRAKVLVTVVVPTLRGVALKGSGDLQLDALDTPALKLALSGSGDARIKDLSTEELVLSLAGSGDVAGQGRAARLRISIAGSGDVSLADLQADDVRVSIAGSGNAAVHAQKSLEVSIAGSGDVSYSGAPSVKSTVAGSGSVRKR